MNLDFQSCYVATKSRDARFDGRFFAAVLTTGVYCRPICPAIMPRPENLQFFVSAAAAEEAGFRPCLRCRPEASPGTPDWQGTSSTVSRALRLITEGVLDECGVDELARRLNIGTRQLRRLFVQHLGAPPIAVAQTRRLHFAKKLIDETRLPLSEVAFCAGFSSIRRFNAAIRSAYGRPPTELRRTGKLIYPNSMGANLQLKLSFRPPFDWRSLIRFLQARAIPGVETVAEDRYRRTAQVGEAAGVIEVQPVEGERHLLLTVPPGLSKGVMQISERVRDLFDLRADPMEIANHLNQDGHMAELVQCTPGLRVPGAWDGFEVAVRAILGQQVNVETATTLAGRLVETYGQAIPTAIEDEPAYLFPRPDRLANASLAEIGVMPKPAEAIRALAGAVGAGDSVFGTAVGLEAAIERLTALPGVGPWTAHYIAMRALGEPDAFPAGDLGLCRAAAETQAGILIESQLQQQAQAWRPWRAYAAMYLWRHSAAG
jgi:AraC family transcriptional regulator of adaptative response / DNA-3-methyladenine glycosylase II